MKRYKHPLIHTVFWNSSCLAWLNIAIQITFSLVLTFTPVIATADNTQHFFDIPTQVYILSEGETMSSVAEKYNMTPEALRMLNQLRTFARGFEHLQPGDELDVPMSPLPVVTREIPNNMPDNEQAQKMAEMTSQVGDFLTNSPPPVAAASVARGMATSTTGAGIQQWLSRFGTARVQLDADKNFSLKNSQFDLLVPLYDKANNLAFSQGSLRRSENRTQLNMGGGVRHFTSRYMLGGNLFGDYDQSRGHARTGIGTEYWRDFLKLDVNGYMRLTNWKNSPDLTSYEERPANGWDVRGQAWLPSMPKLGGKLTYEQYYGKEVALFGKDNRQKNPKTITMGINYTPVPFITVSAEQHQGLKGKSDSRLGVNMSYQLGVPWQQQVNPDEVAAMRCLTGSRYDLVDRNNNIVLEYRKEHQQKGMIRLHTVDLVTGHAREMKSLGVSVTSTYELSRIDWSAPSLLAAGGQIVQKGGDYKIVLPEYILAAHSINTYTVDGIAIDSKGNQSDLSKTQIQVLPPQTPTVSFKYITVNHHSFKTDEGFPTTGFKGAEFTLELSSGNASDFTWKSDTSWVSVSGGVVNFSGTGTGNKVTITATQKTGGNALSYTFQLKRWFRNSSDNMNWINANSFCNSQPGFNLANRFELNGDKIIRSIGSLWGEWGRLDHYVQSDVWKNYGYWTSEAYPKNGGVHFVVNLLTGNIGNNLDKFNSSSVVCRQKF